MEWNRISNKYSRFGFIYVFRPSWTETRLSWTETWPRAGRRRLPQQLIRQPPVRPFNMPVFLVPHFIETPPRLRIGESAGANIGWEIVHSTRTNTRDFTRLSIHVDFLVWVRGLFYNDTYLFRHFSCIIRYRICLHGMRAGYILYTPRIIKPIQQHT